MVQGPLWVEGGLQHLQFFGFVGVVGVVELFLDHSEHHIRRGFLEHTLGVVMGARILDGKALSEKVIEALREEVASMPRPPGLAVVLVGSDPASRIYVRRKGEAANRVGLLHRQIDLPEYTPESELLAVLDALNADPRIDGVLVQLPLPKGIDAARIADRIDPRKDVDGLSSQNAGYLVQGRPALVPCTPLGVMELLRSANLNISGMEACVVGRSNIVGRPMAALLEQANATVTVCHRFTRDLPAVIARSHLVVAAIGRPEWVQGSWIAEGAVVIDVGINRAADGRLCGDVEFSGALARASAITPVPGGVGPMTIAMLLRNTVEAAKRRVER